VDVTAPGDVQKVPSGKKSNYNTPVAFVKLYWATGTDFTPQAVQLRDKLPIFWNEAAGKYVVNGLPMPPPTATHLLLVPQFKDAAGVPQTGTPVAMALPTTRPDLSIADAQVVEGNAGKRGIDFEVTLSTPVPFSITVPFATFNEAAVGGTAKQKADFIHRRGIVTFAPGEKTPKTITIQVKGDTKIEGNESFTVQLIGPSWATLKDPLGVGTIVDDDPVPPALNAALLAWTAADAGLEPASHVAAGRHRESSASGLVAAHDAAFMDSVL
jgi:hypothetical protein